jgi:hypothetical protein
MRVAALGCLYQFVDDVLGSRLVGVAHAEVDDVLARGSRLLLQIPNNIEYIGRQALDALKLGFHSRSAPLGWKVEAGNITEAARACQRGLRQVT